MIGMMVRGRAARPTTGHHTTTGRCISTIPCDPDEDRFELTPLTAEALAWDMEAESAVPTVAARRAGTLPRDAGEEVLEPEAHSYFPLIAPASNRSTGISWNTWQGRGARPSSSEASLSRTQRASVGSLGSRALRASQLTFVRADERASEARYARVLWNRSQLNLGVSHPRTSRSHSRPSFSSRRCLC